MALRATSALPRTKNYVMTENDIKALLVLPNIDTIAKAVAFPLPTVFALLNLIRNLGRA
jgi:hypothetical protein